MRSSVSLCPTIIPEPLESYSCFPKVNGPYVTSLLTRLTTDTTEGITSSTISETSNTMVAPEEFVPEEAVTVTGNFTLLSSSLIGANFCIP